jgi:hypothetical protein
MTQPNSQPRSAPGLTSCRTGSRVAAAPTAVAPNAQAYAGLAKDGEESHRIMPQKNHDTRIHIMISLYLPVALTVLTAVPLRPNVSEVITNPAVTLGSPFAPTAMVPVHGHLALATESCPRLYDRHGARFQTVTGAFLSRHVTPGGGKFVVIKTQFAPAPQSEAVTDEVFDALGSVQPGTIITLFSYAVASLSGAQPAYSCVELSDVPAP